VASTLDYGPLLDGLPYDPEDNGGGVDLLRLYANPARTGTPVVEVGPAVRISVGRYRFSFASPPDGVYYSVVEWREIDTALPFEDANETVVLPVGYRAPFLLVTGADLAAAVGNRIARAALDEAATIISGLIEGWTRGRSVYPDAVPRDLAAVATAAALRLAPNLHQQQSVSTGEQSISGAFRGFTLHEQVTLNRYRRRSA
jgi:hypothetical protein